MKVDTGRRIARAMGGLAVVAATGGIPVTAAAAAAAGQASPDRNAAREQAAAAACESRLGIAAAAVEPGVTTAGFTPELLYAAPRLALERACRELDDAPADDESLRVDPMLDIAESALRAGKLDAARRLLDTLLHDAGDGNGNGANAGIRLARLHVGRADLANAEADTALARRHFADARTALQAAGADRTLGWVAVWVGEATAWRHEHLPGGLVRAAEALDEAAALLAELHRSVSLEMSLVLNERTLLAYARGDLAATLDTARAEVALYRALGLADSGAPLDALITLGGVLSQLGRQDDAEVKLREALRLVERHPGEQPAAALGVLNNYAALQSDRGRHDDALVMADRALADARGAFGIDSARTVTPLTIRGQALKQLGRYGEARRTLDEALRVTAVHAAGLGPLRRLRLQEALAQTLVALGDSAAAEAAIAQGLQETAALDGLDYWRGRLLRLRAALAAKGGDWPAADAAITEAIERIGAVNGARHPYVVDMGSLRCFAQSQGRLPGRACADLAAAVRGLDTVAPGYRFNAMAALAQDDENRGQLDSALTRRLQALAAAESAATPDPLWSAYAALAVQMRATGAKPLAVVLGKQAVEQIERMRASLDADLKRNERGFLADKLVVYRQLADWLTEDGRVDEALDVIRMLKEEEFFDFVDRDGGLLGRIDRGPAYAESEATLRRSWRPPPAQAGGQAANDAAETLRQEHERVATRLDELRRMADPPPESAPSTAAPPVAHVPPPAGEARVWIYSGDHRLNLVIDAPSRRTTAAVDVTPAEIARMVTNLLGAIERREPVLARLQALYAPIGAPLERALAADAVRRVVLTVDGPLRYLPFAALHDGRGFVGERYSVEQRVSSPQLADAATLPLSTAPLRVQAMGVSRSLAGMAPLSEVANEVCGIVAGPVEGLALDTGACGGARTGHGVMAGRGWMNEAFTADRLQTAIGDRRQGHAETRLLHIGTHFVLRPGRINRSWLLLGDGRPLSLDDLGRFDFHGQALVTLSACETGVGSAQWGGSGEEIDGLGGLMLRRGAGGVVASLWRVEDASTSRLMQAFYRQLAAGLGAAAALQRAQAQLRDAGGREAHPFYWAGFYLVTGGH